MKRFVLKIILTFYTLLFTFQIAISQCATCTKTAEQMGEGPAKALNGAIIYLMVMPFAIVGFIGYRWWKNEKQIISKQDSL